MVNRMGGADERHDLDDVPFVIQRLHSDDASHNFDRSGMGPGPGRDKSTLATPKSRDMRTYTGSPPAVVLRRASCHQPEVQRF